MSFQGIPLVVRHFGTCDYQQTWAKMLAFTQARDANSADELWVLEHPPVFTLGQAADHSHVLIENNIPIVKTDRGGQVTYHGPGQIILYPLIDLKRGNYGIRDIVTALENIVIKVLESYAITAVARCDAPGVYVDEAKIASIGLRVKKGCTYHGLAFNIAMDLAPFLQINPCGYRGLRMTQLSSLTQNAVPSEVHRRLIHKFVTTLGYNAELVTEVTQPGESDHDRGHTPNTKTTRQG